MEQGRVHEVFEIAFMVSKIKYLIFLVAAVLGLFLHVPPQWKTDFSSLSDQEIYAALGDPVNKTREVGYFNHIWLSGITLSDITLFASVLHLERGSDGEIQKSRYLLPFYSNWVKEFLAKRLVDET
ncbi:MAG: hypothetical protein GY767_02680 [Shimia sp.]|nr:hypothetical protein [Shimia sp.]